MDPRKERLSLVRNALSQEGIDACIIPLSDTHIQEYVPDHWNVVSWLTGFTGSSAIVLITKDLAEMWTDSRYLIQARNELNGSGFDTFSPVSSRKRDSSDWLEEKIPYDSSVGFDGRIVSVSFYKRLVKRLINKNVRFFDDFDPVSAIWIGRPAMPCSSLWEHPASYSGKDRALKISEVRDKMQKREISFHLLTSPDDIMWLFNLRGHDLLYSPVAISFALIGPERIFFFIDQNRLPGNIPEKLMQSDITVLPYESITETLSAIDERSVMLINPATTSVSILNSIPKTLRITEDVSIPSHLKSVKNRTEIRNIEKTMIKDGVALVRFFYFLENNSGKLPLTEISLADKLHELRSLEDDFLVHSFSPITAFNEHSSMPHYSATADSDAVITEEGILLVDSGGHYMGGTTDITRTISRGKTTEKQKKDFTLVLKGHIRLAGSKFPAGTKGFQLDILAREALWQTGIDYGHGTGHGVGYCLNVHEGPQIGRAHV